MHFGCSKQAVMKKLALNPALKEMQIRGLTEHCMDAKCTDPIGMEASDLEILDVVRRDTDWPRVHPSLARLTLRSSR